MGSAFNVQTVVLYFIPLSQVCDGVEIQQQDELFEWQLYKGQWYGEPSHAAHDAHFQQMWQLYPEAVRRLGARAARNR
jgi:hypothetical protein